MDSCKKFRIWVWTGIGMNIQKTMSSLSDLDSTLSYTLVTCSMHGAKFRYSHPAIYVGSFVTITCLMIMSVTYIISYTSITMPKKAKHSVINTWFAMALLAFLYSIGIQQTEHIEICQGVGLALHYLSLCCLLWMAVSAR